MARREGCNGAGLQGSRLAAMDVVLQHPAISTNQHILLSIPTVCRAWRTAAQQARSRALDVQLILSSEPPVGDKSSVKWPPGGIVQLTDFGSWLSKYAGLVHSISISGDYSWLDSDNIQPLCKRLAEPILVLALQAATSQSTAAAPQQPLQLHSYDSNILHSSAVLQAFSRTGIACLRLMHCSVANAAAALQQLPSLRSLQLVWDTVTNVQGSVAALGQHGGLTRLTLDCVKNIDPQQLPGQLRELEVHFANNSTEAKFGHLARLTSLVVSFQSLGFQDAGRPCEGAQLPPHLVELEVNTAVGLRGGSAVRNLNITALQQLTKLTLENSQENQEDLLALRGMPQLRHLAISYGNAHDGIAAISAVWQGLKQLRSISFHHNGMYAAEFQELVQNLAAVTWLTGLNMCFDVYPSEAEEQEEEQQQPAEQQMIGFCDQIAKLQNLQELVLCCIQDDGVTFVSGDAHHLSALTRLTRLRLDASGDHADDVAVTAILLSLTQLQWLDTYAYSAAILPVIGRLKHLRRLELSGLMNVSDQVKSRYLDPLQHLTYIQL